LHHIFGLDVVVQDTTHHAVHALVAALGDVPEGITLTRKHACHQLRII
jgi:hypothetical protein